MPGAAGKITAVSVYNDDSLIFLRFGAIGGSNMTGYACNPQEYDLQEGADGYTITLYKGVVVPDNYEGRPITSINSRILSLSKFRKLLESSPFPGSFLSL